MASVTFKVVQNETVREDGTQLVMIRVTYLRKHKYVGTEVFVRQKHFNPDGNYEKENWIRKSHDQALLLNGTLKGWLDKGAKVNKTLNQLGRPFTVEEVKRRMEQSDKLSLADHIRDFIAVLEEREEKGTADNHRYIFNTFCRFLNLDPTTGDFSIYQLTPELMERYETYLLTRPVSRKKSTEASRRNTASEYLRKLHQHISSFIIKHKLPSEIDPLRGWVSKTAPTDRITLNEAELRVWLSLELPTRTKGERTTAHARNMYFISYYLHGLRAFDIMAAKVSQVQKE